MRRTFVDELFKEGYKANGLEGLRFFDTWSGPEA